MNLSRSIRLLLSIVFTIGGANLSRGACPEVINSQATEFYLALPTTGKIKIGSGWSITDRIDRSGRLVTTVLFEHQTPQERVTNEGYITTALELDSQGQYTFVVHSVFPYGPFAKSSSMPHWISAPDLPELVPGRGTPTGLFLIMRSLRRLIALNPALTLDKIHRIEFAKIINKETVFQLDDLARTWRKTHSGDEVNQNVLSELARQTTFYLLGRTIATLAGFQIKSVAVDGGRPEKIGSILGFAEQDPPQFHQENDPILQRYGRSRNDSILRQFNLDIEVAADSSTVH